MLFTSKSSNTRRIMKSVVTYCFLLLVFGVISNESLAQPNIKADYTVPATDGSIISTFVTNPSVIYTVTVQGIYSLTSEPNAVKGDGLAIFSVPAGINSQVWPFRIFDVNNVKYTIYPLPLLFTNDTTYPTESQKIGIPGLNKATRSSINAAKHLGFRFDGRVIPFLEYNASNRYQFQVNGTGKPFKLQIIDSVQSIVLERTLPSYIDNSGALSVTIEETVVQFCEEPKPIYDKDSVLIALDLSIGVFVDDSTSVSGKTNILSETTDLAVFHKIRSSKDSVGLTIDSSFFLCPETIECAKQNERGVALAMVLDRSGSMLDFISPVDSRIRITEAKDASTQFVDRLGDKDEAMIISFADESRVDQVWTKNKSALKNAINALVPTGFTAMNEGVIRAIDSIRKHPNPNRAIILLSDGGNNRWPEFSAVVDKIKEDTINPLPIYSIAFGLNKNDPLDLAGLNDLKELARLTRGKTFEVYSAGSLDSVYKQLTREVVNDRCCVLRVPIPPCAGPDDTLRTIKVLMPVNGKVEINTITYRPNCSKIKDTVISSLHDSNVFVYRGEDAQPVSELMPNPSNGQATLGYEVSRYGNVSIDIYAQDGSLVRSILNAPQDQGRYKIAIDMTSEVQGYYSVIIKIDGLTIMRPMIITR
jgi:hypothetical protein